MQTPSDPTIGAQFALLATRVANVKTNFNFSRIV
jgi:hypothetical protein